MNTHHFHIVNRRCQLLLGALMPALLCAAYVPAASAEGKAGYTSQQCDSNTIIKAGTVVYCTDDTAAGLISEGAIVVSGKAMDRNVTILEGAATHIQMPHECEITSAYPHREVNYQVYPASVHIECPSSSFSPEPYGEHGRCSSPEHLESGHVMYSCSVTG